MIGIFQGAWGPTPTRGKTGASSVVSRRRIIAFGPTSTRRQTFASGVVFRRRVAGFVLALAIALGVASAQIPWPWRGRGEPSSGDREDFEASNVAYDGRFVFVRLRYRSGFGGFNFRREPPWSHDYPRADTHFMKILNELTYLAPYMEGSNILSLDDPELFNFPFAYMSEPGFWTLTDGEAAALRAYLLKGGFLIFDDFRGSDWENFQAQLKRALPKSRLIELNASHPIFHSFFEINSLEEFVQFYDRGTPVFYGVFEDNDPQKRMMVIANYNNDIGEYWEFSDTGFVPIDLSNEAYKFGVNYAVYALTH